jgi:hypothetical protein
MEVFALLISEFVQPDVQQDVMRVTLSARETSDTRSAAAATAGAPLTTPKR